MNTDSQQNNPEKTNTCQVAVPIALRQHFDYICHQPIPAGSRVLVPFAQRKLVGVVLSNDKPETNRKLKRVIRVLDKRFPTFDSHLIELLRWASGYYHHPIGEVFNTAMPAVLRAACDLDDPRCITTYRVCVDASSVDLKRAPLQKKLFEFLLEHESADAAALNNAFSSWRVAINVLMKKGLVTTEQRQNLLDKSLPDYSGHVLTTDQQAATDKIQQLLTAHNTLLLYGVTGSGKTEVYLQAAISVIKAGLQVLFLVPEIALTPQWIVRVKQRLGEAVVILHSGLTDRQRYQAWWQAGSGDAHAILGTRSAVFVPLARPGLIIIDEEHDQAFKQQEGFRYRARDLAIMRASMLSIPVVLGSATPSLETIFNSRHRHYNTAYLSGRIGVSRLPVVNTIDIKQHPLKNGISQALRSAIAQRLSVNEQTIIFLNRRGFSPLLQCDHCGWQASCARCDAYLVLHKTDEKLRCHHCGYKQNHPDRCPECNSSKLFTIGAGTQRIDQELGNLFPEARIIRLDRDRIKTHRQLEKQLSLIHNHEADILVGTQLITKGHDFPRVTLVGVINADQGLYSTDFRSREQLFQQLLQVGGRAGRAEHPGEVLIQTAHPCDPFFDYIRRHDYSGYANLLLDERQQAGLPPFKPLSLFRSQSTHEEKPLLFLAWVAKQATLYKDKYELPITVFDPVSSPMTKHAGRYRAQLLLRAENRRSLHALLTPLLNTIESSRQSRNTRWSIDVDPVDLY